MNPNSIQSTIRFALGAFSLGLLAACGGGSDELGDPKIADGGIRGTGSSVGPVSGFGSVFVNGVRFDTSGLNGQVESDDGISRESDLEKGMILRVDGTWRDEGEGTASHVGYDDTLRGEVVVTQAWDPETKTATLSLFGLIVHIDSLTVVRGKKVAELADGDSVRVSAWRLPGGEFRASLLRVRTNSSAATFDQENEVELEGQVSDFNEMMRTFRIGDVTVEYDSEITSFDGVGVSELATNPYIEVEGSFLGTGALLAKSVAEDDLRRYRRGGGDDIEFAGPVSEALNDAESSFRINGVTVRITEDTDFEDGLASGNLRPGLLVQIEGEFLDGSTVEAKEIDLREGESEVEGSVDVNSVDASAKSFRIAGVQVQVTPQTTIIGEDDARLDFESLGGPREVEVNGVERVAADGEVYLEAFKIEIGDDMAEDEFKLVGRLRAMDFFSVNVLGVRIDVNTSTDFEGANSQDALQNLLNGGARPLIEVKYRQTTSRDFIAEEIELENSD